MGSRANAVPEHWTRVKAHSRRVGIFKLDEYDTLRPIVDLILRLQEMISTFLSEPLEWSPPLAVDVPDDVRIQGHRYHSTRGQQASPRPLQATND